MNEEQVQTKELVAKTFAAMMATHLRFLCDGKDDGLGRTM